MPRVEIPLIGPSYTNREKPLSAQVARNMWPEINPEARNQVALHNTAGIRTFATLSGVDRGMTDFNNLMYAVSGQTLYSIDADGTNFALGTIAGTDRVVMANDSLQLIIVTGDIPYKYTIANGVEEITDPDLVKPTTVAYLNNQFIFDQNAGVFGEFVTSSVDPDFSVDALDFAQAESHPDDIIAIVAFRQLVYMFGSHSVEPWQNTGVGNPPFARVNSGVQPYGLAGLHGITKTDEFMYYLDTKRIPRRSNGLNHLNIGNPALGVEFAKYSKIDDVIAFDFVQDNQQFVAFTFPEADRTWCFHEPSGSWFELSYIETGAMNNPATPLGTFAPAYIGPDVANIEYTVNVAITPVSTSHLFVGDNIVYSLVGSWPTGLSIDSGTGVISGTPTGTLQAYTGLVVRATNSFGSADATAYQITLAEAPYEPGMMTFSSSYYKAPSDNFNHTGNKGTLICRINRAPFTGGGAEVIMVGEKGFNWGYILLWASDHATVEFRNKVRMLVQDSSGVTICNLLSDTELADSTTHTLHAAFDGDIGAATFYVDGLDADDAGYSARVAPTTGTLPGGTPGDIVVAAGPSPYASTFTGKIGYVGVSDSYLTNPTDFHHPTNGLQEIDESGWTEFGSQPQVWNQFGTCSDNKGSFSNLTAVGTITGPA